MESPDKNNEQFLKEVQKQLEKESDLNVLCNGKSAKTAKRIEDLVQILEDYDPTDRVEMLKSKMEFQKALRETHKKEMFWSRVMHYGKQAAAGITLGILIIISGNVITQATMHKSLADVILGRNLDMTEYQMSAEYKSITFETVAGVEQYLNRKLVLPETVFDMEITEIRVDKAVDKKDKVYITYSNDNGKYLSFCMMFSEYNSVYSNIYALEDDWKDCELHGLNLSNVKSAIKEDRIKIYTYINEALYEIDSDLPEEDLVGILNTIPLP